MRSFLKHGEFFGAHDASRTVEGFSLSVAAADPDRDIAQHTHEEAHFVFVLDGYYHSTAKGAGHLHSEPALIYNPPGTTHRDTFPHRRGRFLGLSLSRARFEEVGEVSQPVRYATRLWEPFAIACAHRIERAVTHGASELDIEGLCLELVGVFLDEGEQTRPPTWLRRAREVLHDRACERFTIRDVAMEAGVHPVHLARLFRRFYGCAPTEYVRRRRVERSADLLRRSWLPLAQIALDCGFSDQSHFARSFVRQFGARPGDYRRRHRSERHTTERREG